MGRQKITDNLDTFLNYLNELYPDAHCELNYNDAFTLLISVLLSAQTTDNAVNKVTKTLFSKYNSPSALVNANTIELQEIIKPLGLYRNKSKNIIELSKKIMSDFNGIVPSTISELTALPGVGRKTASVVLIEYFKMAAFPVDTHIIRISKRLGLANEKDNVEVVEQKLKNCFNENLWCKLHHQMIFFGRYRCKSKKPLCNNCKLKNYCKFGYNSSITHK